MMAIISQEEDEDEDLSDMPLSFSFKNNFAEDYDSFVKQPIIKSIPTENKFKSSLILESK